eukprot:3726169-Pyramimonas_sp.AAC.1
MSSAYMSSAWSTSVMANDSSKTSNGLIMASCRRNMATEQPGSTPLCTCTAYEYDDPHLMRLGA